MTRQVWKFPFTFEDHVAVAMPAGAEVLHVDIQMINEVETPCIWALVNPRETKLTSRRFRLAGTGHPIVNAEFLKYVGTFKMPPLVFHLFEGMA